MEALLLGFARKPCGNSMSKMQCLGTVSFGFSAFASGCVVAFRYVQILVRTGIDIYFITYYLLK